VTSDVFVSTGPPVPHLTYDLFHVTHAGHDCSDDTWFKYDLLNIH